MRFKSRLVRLKRGRRVLFFMKHGHITAVELLPGLNDEEAVKRSHELFAARKNEAGYGGFEVWRG
jgi:hypothetical protein